ncbi:hypothetical protein RRG08_016634 [Elysia crispata]|uniref:J domain-containing protein n=1 Tax=Elysia crispata TaxID=231223 RepID=A0AAE0YXD6_9GAST|nr:hypothetical protein RRG08_016634 [Elysia crispata]
MTYHCKHLRWLNKQKIILNLALTSMSKKASWTCFPRQSCIKLEDHRKSSLFIPCRCMSNTKNHYEVLGLGKNASSEDIRAAFLRRSKECHPDINRSNPENHRQFVQVNEAYSVLSRPQARKYYDSTLDRSSASSEPPPPYSDYYQHPRETLAEDWLRQSGLKEDYFNHGARQHLGRAGKNKISNFHIVASCLVFMMTGIVFHIFAVKRSSERHIQSLNDRDLRTHELWMNAKRDAKKFTPQEFGQHLLDHQESQKNQPRR